MLRCFIDFVLRAVHRVWIDFHRFGSLRVRCCGAKRGFVVGALDATCNGSVRRTSTEACKAELARAGLVPPHVIIFLTGQCLPFGFIMSFWILHLG
ncbi:MAG: hypothetical protein CBD74_08850 [Saprospirales bacterium TMED214]|nr:MAG: hypothetical protein CBD74_08850 [Saprospirales bacterium TMED214]